MKNFRWTLVAALMLAAPQIAQAQPPGVGGPGGPGTTTSTTTETGGISNAAVAPEGTATTTTTVATSTDITPEGVVVEDTQTELANTGGAPVLMSLSGIAMALAAFGLRRKVS